MLRFEKNRWWTLVLALALCLACTASQPGSARAGSGEIIEVDPTSGSGQPDQPTGPTKQKPGLGAAQWDGGAVHQVRSVGDGRITTGVWMWRLQVIVRSLRSVYFRF